MTSIEPAASHLTQTEIDEEISSISDAGWIRLRKVAVKYSYGRINPDDLLQEAFLSALEGRRKCPKDIDIIKFLAEAMRSLSSSEIKSLKSKPALQIISTSEDNDNQSTDIPDLGPTSEQIVISGQESVEIKSTILSLFSDDEIAQVIVEGDMEGMASSEIQDISGLDKKAFASKRRLIRRRIDRAFPEGWKQ
jgi:DNA-directed RNA polymerase specialized sigma24 family protein